MESKINLNTMNKKIKNLKTLLTKEKEKEEKSKQIFEKLLYGQYLVTEIKLTRCQTEFNMSEAKKIWETLRNGTKTSMSI